MEQQLIALYLCVCGLTIASQSGQINAGATSVPRFTDEELVTIYLFGHTQGFQQQRRIYDYARHHWLAGFPHLPSYQAFSRRLSSLAPAFEHLITTALNRPATALAADADRLIDSLPISLAKWPRCAAARVAAGVADQGHCSTKRSYYYGVFARLRGSSCMFTASPPSRVGS